MGIRIVIIPPHPGVFSAFGLLFAEMQLHQVQSMLCPVHQVSADTIERIFGGMAAEARAALQGATPDGEASIWLERRIDLRYSGQAYELTVPLPAGASADAMEASFAAEHERIYGYSSPDDTVELVNLRQTAHVLDPRQVSPESFLTRRSAPEHRKSASRAVYFGADLGWLDTPVVGRAEVPDRHISGPMIVEEYDTTTVVPPDCQVLQDEWGNIIMTVAG
jgi:N-methylhydantoinase A